jgi:hypothetical protein
VKMGREQRTVTGRRPKPLFKKINPIWWFGNDDEEQLPHWYRPSWPNWRRRLYWYFFRNPLQNFRAYVVGVNDRNYDVVGRIPVMCVQRNDLNPVETGWQWSVIKLAALRLPFVSYSGKKVVWYIGWQPSGFFGAKFNLHSKQA